GYDWSSQAEEELINFSLMAYTSQGSSSSLRSDSEVIVNGDSVSSVASASAEGPIPPKTAKQKLVRKNELKAKKHFYASHSK
nr:hypothetical protein [Tanacetum cinerariifolium]